MAPVTDIVVRVKPNSHRPGIEVEGSRILVRVGEPPHDGRANDAVRELLAEALDLPRGRVNLKRGARSREKTFSIEGLERDIILARLGSTSH